MTTIDNHATGCMAVQTWLVHSATAGPIAPCSTALAYAPARTIWYTYAETLLR